MDDDKLNEEQLPPEEGTEFDLRELMNNVKFDAIDADIPASISYFKEDGEFCVEVIVPKHGDMNQVINDLSDILYNLHAGKLQVRTLEALKDGSNKNISGIIDSVINNWIKRHLSGKSFDTSNGPAIRPRDVFRRLG